MQGQLIVNMELKVNGGASQFNLDISDDSKGVYLFQFSGDSGVVNMKITSQ
jgi:hypothetical protein